MVSYVGSQRILREALVLAEETLSLHDSRGLSLASGLAVASRRLSPRSQATKAAYRMLMELLRRRNLVDFLVANSVSVFSHEIEGRARRFLEIYFSEVVHSSDKLRRKRAIRLSKAARRAFGRNTLRAVEPHIGYVLTLGENALLAGLDPATRKSLSLSHPKWFVDYSAKLLGRRQSTRLMRRNMEEAPTYVRINSLAVQREEEFLESLESQGITLKRDRRLPSMYVLKSTEKPLVMTAEYREGLFSIQDFSTCFCVYAASPLPGSTILDVCAAPGIKTTLLAQIMKNRGSIHSIDVSRRRIRSWREMIQRLGVKIAEPIIADATRSLPFRSKMDLVLVDPPCSNTGVYWRDPSMKWRVRERAVRRFSRIQDRILLNSARHVKQGGVLLYSTCSVTLEENEMVIENFLRRRHDFRLEEIQVSAGISGMRGLSECRRLYPHEHEANGFFVAKLTKEA